MIAEGATLQEIADASGATVSGVRSAVIRLGLQTRRMASNREARTARSSGAAEIQRVCSTHGLAQFRRDINGSYRCLRCRAERVKARRRRIKEILVAEAGGRCVVCGYERCLRALGFHHLDPASKEFGVAFRGATRSLARARFEAAKCVLLCANCHMEVEAGVTSLPFDRTIGGSSIGRAGRC